VQSPHRFRRGRFGQGTSFERVSVKKINPTKAGRFPRVLWEIPILRRQQISVTFVALARFVVAGAARNRAG
jgi:hypothetical protein